MPSQVLFTFCYGLFIARVDFNPYLFYHSTECIFGADELCNSSSNFCLPVGQLLLYMRVKARSKVLLRRKVERYEPERQSLARSKVDQTLTLKLCLSRRGPTEAETIQSSSCY